MPCRPSKIRSPGNFCGNSMNYPFTSVRRLLARQSDALMHFCCPIGCALLSGIPFFVFIDECHRFLTEDVAKLFTQGRKFRVSPILLTQGLGDLRDAGDRIFSLVMQAATKVLFRIAEDDDALYLARSAFRSQ